MRALEISGRRRSSEVLARWARDRKSLQKFECLPSKFIEFCWNQPVALHFSRDRAAQAFALIKINQSTQGLHSQLIRRSNPFRCAQALDVGSLSAEADGGSFESLIGSARSAAVSAP
jgi:hypothetical protein